MASLLRQIVAGPRSRHPEANLDLCYVTDNIVATSGPSSSYPSLAYRNPLSELVSFLDSRHGDQWCIFEFRAEGCGYPDDLVYGRIWHWPWPDHHPPPFALVPKIMGSMRAWLDPADNKDNKRVAVVHCKAGKGRSGSMAVSYMISHMGWNKTEALQRFTERRMRPGFGSGVSIPSQLRWVSYVERWASHGGRMYVERRVQVKEVHIWGLKDGVRMAIEGFAESGKKIKEVHVFTQEERDDLELLAVPNSPYSPITKTTTSRTSLADVVSDKLKRQRTRFSKASGTQSPIEPHSAASSRSSAASSVNNVNTDGSAAKTTTTAEPASPTTSTNVILRPSKPIILESSDINLTVERRSNAHYKLSTSIAHVWFNCYFEGAGPENYKKAGDQGNGDGEAVSGTPWSDNSGVFTIDWDAMDGIKGSSRKGVRAFDKVAVVWAAVPDDDDNDDDEDDNNVQGTGNATATHHRKTLVLPEPRPGEPITPVEAADWRGVPFEEIDLYSSGKLGRDETDLPRSDRSTEDGDNGLKNQTATDEGEDDEDGAEGVRYGLQENSAIAASETIDK